jgi:hypothetical protein
MLNTRHLRFSHSTLDNRMIGAVEEGSKMARRRDESGSNETVYGTPSIASIGKPKNCVVVKIFFATITLEVISM